MSDKLYLVIFSGEDFTREQLCALFDGMPEVKFWFYNIPNSVFVIAGYSSKELSVAIDAKFGTRGRHFITPVDTGWWGRLPGEHWEYFKNVTSYKG
jgi:hypothetical protein